MKSMCCDEIPYNKLGRALAKSRAKGIISPPASASRGSSKTWIWRTMRTPGTRGIHQKGLSENVGYIPNYSHLKTG